MLFIRLTLSLRNVEYSLCQSWIDVRHETVRFRWNRFGPMFTAGTWKRRIPEKSCVIENSVMVPSRCALWSNRDTAQEVFAGDLALAARQADRAALQDVESVA